MKRYQTDEEYRKYILKQKSERFKKRYHNDIAFRKKHEGKNKIFRQTEKGKQIDRNISAKCYYKNHDENKKKQADRHRDKYWSDEEYRKAVKRKNRNWLKTEAGQLASKSRRESRKEYEDNLLRENIIVGAISKHHLTDKIIIFIPTDLHFLYTSRPKETHRENLQYIVNQIYDIDLQEMGYYKK